MNQAYSCTNKKKTLTIHRQIAEHRHAASHQRGARHDAQHIAALQAEQLLVGMLAVVDDNGARLTFALLAAHDFPIVDVAVVETAAVSTAADWLRLADGSRGTVGTVGGVGGGGGGDGGGGYRCTIGGGCEMDGGRGNGGSGGVVTDCCGIEQIVDEKHLQTVVARELHNGQRETGATASNGPQAGLQLRQHSSAIESVQTAQIWNVHKDSARKRQRDDDDARKGKIGLRLGCRCAWMMLTVPSACECVVIRSMWLVADRRNGVCCYFSPVTVFWGFPDFFDFL